MGKQLRISVHGVADSDGAVHSFLPGVDVPDWAREQISNPNVWAVDEDTEPVDESNDDQEQPIKRAARASK